MTTIKTIEEIKDLLRKKQITKKETFERLVSITEVSDDINIRIQVLDLIKNLQLLIQKSLRLFKIINYRILTRILEQKSPNLSL